MPDDILGINASAAHFQIAVNAVIKQEGDYMLQLILNELSFTRDIRFGLIANSIFANGFITVHDVHDAVNRFTEVVVRIVIGRNFKTRRMQVVEHSLVAHLGSMADGSDACHIAIVNRNPQSQPPRPCAHRHRSRCRRRAHNLDVHCVRRYRRKVALAERRNHALAAANHRQVFSIHSQALTARERKSAAIQPRLPLLSESVPVPDAKIQNRRAARIHHIQRKRRCIAHAARKDLAQVDGLPRPRRQAHSLRSSAHRRILP